jgi:hypothetical protein
MARAHLRRCRRGASRPNPTAVQTNSPRCSRRRLVYATESREHDGELTPANDRDDYVTTTADWALALRRNGSGYGRL